MINVGLMRKADSNLKRDGSRLGLRDGCCNRAHLGQNAESTPFRSDLLCAAASTNYFIATLGSSAKATRRAAAIDDRHNDDCVPEARPGTLGIPRSCTNAEEAFTPPSRSLCNKALLAMGFWRHLRLPSSINRPVAPPTHVSNSFAGLRLARTSRSVWRGESPPSGKVCRTQFATSKTAVC
jgi:hypothetical protein